MNAGTVILACSVMISPSRAFTQEVVLSKVDTTLGRSLFENGKSFQMAARYDTAIALFDRAAGIYSQSTNISNYLRCLNAKAQCLQLKGNYDKALDVLNIGSEAEQRLLKDSPVIAAQRLVLIGTCYRRLGKFDSAFVAARNAAELSRNTASSDRHLQWEINTLFAGTYFDLGEHDSALVFDERALNLLEVSRKEDQEDLSGTYGNIGEIYESRGDYQKALDYFVRSLDVRRTIAGEKNPEVAIAYNNIAAIYMRQGDYDLSVEYYQKSLSIMNEILESDNPSFGFRYNNIAMAYRSRGEFEKALEAGNRAKTIFVRKLGAKHPNVGGVVNNIGRTYSDMKHYDRALEAYKEALAIWEPKLGAKHPYVMQSYFNIGEAYGNLGNLDSAARWLRQSLNTRREILGEKNVKVAQSYSGLAVVAAKNGELYASLEYYQKAMIALVDDFNDSATTANPVTLKSASDLDLLASLCGKAEVLERRASGAAAWTDLKASLKTFERASELVETIRHSLGAEGSKIQLGALAFNVNEGAIHVAHRLLEGTHDQEYAAVAFSFAERSKAGILWDAIADSKAKHFSGIPDSLLERESTLNIDLAYNETQLQKEKEKRNRADKAKIDRWENALFDTRQRYTALIGQFEKEFPAYHALKQETSFASLSDVQQKVLDDKSALLEYVAGDTTVTILAVTRRHCLIKVVELHGSLASMVRRFRHAVQNIDDSEYVDVASTLYQQLVAPVLAELKGNRKIFIIPDGILNYLPFEALLTKPVHPSAIVDFSTLPYFLRQFEISYQLSAQLLVEGTKKTGTGAFVGMAPVFVDKPAHAGPLYTAVVKSAVSSTAEQKPVLRSITVNGERFAELKESETEVKDILGLFQAHHRSGKVFLHEAAQEAELKSPDIQTFDFIHIASHGLMNEEDPELSGIVLSPPDTGAKEDGVLYSGEIYNLRLNADLVVLSACESGLGAIAKGEGMLGLTRGFLYAGARNVVVSLWQVGDKSTANLMVQFYRNILEGRKYSAALRTAKLALITGKTYAHPLEWSPFVLTGR
jgi:CHAT domain-containing protein/Tfp pilus assembly protein PilF